MGTRGLTAVIHKQKPVVAQYGQWDHYPEGQGAKIVTFLRGMDIDKMKTQVEKCRWITDEEAEQINKEFGEWMDIETANRYKEKYPLLSRDVGGEIVQHIYESESPEIILGNNWNFIKDSLFCEWAYIIDLDKQTLQVCRGFQTEPDPANPYGTEMAPSKSSEYYPCKPVIEWPLGSIPEDWIEQVYNLLKDEDEDEDEDEQESEPEQKQIDS